MDLAGLPGSLSYPAQVNPRKVKGHNVQFDFCVCAGACLCPRVQNTVRPDIRELGGSGGGLIISPKSGHVASELAPESWLRWAIAPFLPPSLEEE